MFAKLARIVILFGSLCALASSLHVSGIEGREENLDVDARSFLKRAIPSAPRWVVYSDEWVSGETGPPAPSAVTGFNVFALSFLLLEGPWDQVETWASLTAAQRSTYKSQYTSAGISLIVSVFGSTDAPTSTNANPTTTAATMAAFVLDYDLDGIDVDYEDFNAFDATTGTAEAWLITFTQQLRAQLPVGQYILTHAPVAPWFSPNIWSGGGYLQVHAEVGSMIDWYNVQFYSQGATEYTTCTGLLTASSSTWPKSALFQIAASGVTLDKLVIGKPGTSGDASTGYMAPSTLAGCLETAKGEGWDAGAMAWQYPDAASSWITTVRSESWPV